MRVWSLAGRKPTANKQAWEPETSRKDARRLRRKRAVTMTCAAVSSLLNISQTYPLIGSCFCFVAKDFRWLFSVNYSTTLKEAPSLHNALEVIITLETDVITVYSTNISTMVASRPPTLSHKVQKLV